MSFGGIICYPLLGEPPKAARNPEEPLVLYHRRRCSRKDAREHMLIIDGHEDIAYNALAWGRDIRLSAYAIRERETQGSTGHPVNPGRIAMSGLPELRRVGIGIVFGAIFTYPLHNATYKGEGNSQTYSTAEDANRSGQEQFAYYRE